MCRKKCLPLHSKNGGGTSTVGDLTSSAVNRENSSVGRAQPCQGWGRGFESRFSLKMQSLASTMSGWRNW